MSEKDIGLRKLLIDADHLCQAELSRRDRLPARLSLAPRLEELTQNLSHFIMGNVPDNGNDCAVRTKIALIKFSQACLRECSYGRLAPFHRPAIRTLGIKSGGKSSLSDVPGTLFPRLNRCDNRLLLPI